MTDKPEGRLARAASLIWNLPGNAWRGAIAAANVTLWWRFGAAILVTGLFAWIIWIFWKGRFWPGDGNAWHVRGDWLGWFGMSCAFLLLVCIVALMDFRLNFRASRTGIEANMAGDEDPPPPLTVETTTTTTVGAQQPPAAPEQSDPTMYGGPRP